MTWKDQLNEGLAAFGVQIPDSVPLDQWAQKLGDNPCRNTAAVVALSSLLFYAAERDHNPKVNDVFDAAVYCSTCLSVGYGDIFAKTPLGKLLGTALMTLGPALSGAALPRREGQARRAALNCVCGCQARFPRHLSGEFSCGRRSRICLSVPRICSCVASRRSAAGPSSAAPDREGPMVISAVPSNLPSGVLAKMSP